MTAATILERTGHREPRVLVGGAEDWARATGRQLEEGV
jgi:hydroxyacylglutathione hydrolase